MNKSYIVHYKNKYPGGRIFATDASLDVWDVHGNHCVSMARGGNGGTINNGFGEIHGHSAHPIPRNTRVWKLERDGSIVKDERAETRAVVAAAAEKEYGHVPSLADLARAAIAAERNCDPVSVDKQAIESKCTNQTWLAQFDDGGSWRG